MKWRIVEVSQGDEREDDLTSAELLGLSILAAHHCGLPHNDLNVYYRAWLKIQPQVEKAIVDREGP